MITNPTPVTTAASFDQLFVSNVMLFPGAFLTATAYPSDGVHTLRTPVKSLRKKSNEVTDIENAIVAEAFRQAGLTLGDTIKRIIINTSDIDAAINIRVDAVDSSDAALPPFVIRDARDLLKNDSAFATVFSTSMVAIGSLF